MFLSCTCTTCTSLFYFVAFMLFLRDYCEEHGTDACSVGQTKGELHLHDLLKRITCGKTMFWIYIVMQTTG